MTIKGIRFKPAISLLPVLLILLSHHSFGQNPLDDIKVSFRSNNKALHAVLDDLTDQTGYYFTFDSRMIDSQKETSITLQKTPLRLALDSIFQHPGLNYQVINRNIVILPQTKMESETTADSTDRIEFTEVHGTVSDVRNGKELPHATVGVKGTHFGTITNLNGNFVLRLPDTLQQPILVISYIGYRNYYVPISIESDDIMKVKMSKNYISLQEVIIRYQDPMSLLAESIKQIDENYMDKPAGVIAYYRERVQKDEKCLVFSEAVVEIDKAPYSSASTLERTRIIKGRKITNVDIRDTVLLKIRAGISTMLELDIVHNLPDFLSDDFIFRYNFSFDNIVSYEDKLVYVIRFSPKEGIDEMLFKGKIYLDRESLAIIAADFKYDPARIGREQNMFVTRKSRGVNVRPLGANYHVEYKNSEEGYHLNQVHGEVSFKVRKKRQWIASKYTIKLEMAVTNISPGNPPQIKLNEKIKSNTVMSDQMFNYDPDFWGDYNTIAPETTLQEALQKIEKSLQEFSE
jgi:hypothetical protein